MNLSYLLTLLSNGTHNENKARLNKQKTTDDFLRDLNMIFERNFYIICIAAIVFLLIIFCIVCYVLVGVSAVESGTVYNHMEAVI